MAGKEIKDANIPNSVNQDAIKEKIMSDHNVAMFARLGAKLLEDTERPNIITLAQFEPFIPLFNADKKKLEEDKEYRLQYNRLLNQYVRGLGINIHQPTIVVVSEEDRTELYFLDRWVTRIRSDSTGGESLRDTVPAAVSRVASMTRDQLLLDASIRDLVDANNTPEQKEHFARIKIDSALIQKNFVERNMSPEKRAELFGEEAALPKSSDNSPMTFFLDDDDD